MQLRQPAPDALVSFSDFLLERLGLDATMQLAVIASIAIHAFLIVGLGFRIPHLPAFDEPHNVMDVVLVNAKSAHRPQKADALAQANLDGGGNTDRKLRASSPLPAVDARDPTRDLIDKSLEIARLEAQIRREHQAYQERPRRTFVGARAAEYRFAQYIDGWRRKIERIGNLNYPAEAKANRIYGSLQLTVAIRADGEIESVEINRPSGHKVLDQAALRIVRLAAPFDRFPANIRA